MVKKLVFDAQEEEGEVDDIELTLDGVVHYVSKPTSGQVTIMMAAFAEDVPAPEAAKAILDFFKNISVTEYDEYDDDDQGVPGTEQPNAYQAIKGILANPRIPDSLEQMFDLTEKVIEAATGNPTKSPTDYLPSRRSGGRSSTGSRRPKASTRSRSPRPASATGSTATSSAD